MKKIIAIVAIVASAQASAFWDSANGSTTGNYNGAGDMAGNGTGEAEGTFSMTFKGRGQTAGDFKGNANTSGNASGYGYDQPQYGAPVMMAPAAPVAPAAQ